MEDFLNARKHLSPVLTKHTDIIVKEGRGLYITDINGKVYLDFVQGIATNPLGHCNEKVVEAIKEQASELIGASFSYYDIPITLKLLEKLSSCLPKRLDSILLSNSGGEANEGAIKLARFHTNRNAVIGFWGSYHGRGYGANTFTTISASARSNIGSLLSDAYFIPYPAKDQCPSCTTEDDLTRYSLMMLQNTFNYLILPNRVAAIIIEPILGDGGYHIPPRQFIKELRKICTQNGIMLIFDEVQTGYGRTGKMFAFEHFGVTPDILTLGKPMASGLPMSAMISSSRITKKWQSGSHGGSTFTGNPISSAAAFALLEEYERLNILKSVTGLGSYFLTQLNKLKVKHSLVGEVRGIGLFIGLEIVDKSGLESGTLLSLLLGILIKNGMVCARCGLKGGVLRLISPLNITKAEIDRAVSILDRSLYECYEWV